MRVHCIGLSESACVTWGVLSGVTGLDAVRRFYCWRHPTKRFKASVLYPVKYERFKA